jgi:molybdopterin molybdotransferase
VRRPRVAVLVTGDELVAPGEPLGPGQIHDSNSTLIAARCRELGADVVLERRVPDDAAATRDAFAAALAAADVVLSSGGVSVGAHDHVKDALRALGAEELFWRVAIQPGKPVFAASAGAVRIVGLPGNPLSVLAGLELLVRPLLALLSGRAEPGPPRIAVRLASALRRNAHRMRVLPVELRGGEAIPLGAGMSHLVARAAAADGLVLIPPGDGEEAAGATLEAVPFADVR